MRCTRSLRKSINDLVGRIIQLPLVLAAAGVLLIWQRPFDGLLDGFFGPTMNSLVIALCEDARELNQSKALESYFSKTRKLRVIVDPATLIANETEAQILKCLNSVIAPALPEQRAAEIPAYQLTVILRRIEADPDGPEHLEPSRIYLLGPTDAKGKESPPEGEPRPTEPPALPQVALIAEYIWEDADSGNLVLEIGRSY